jgi:hypothetical protein
VETFQEYHDTVIAVGLSHLPRNFGIFSTADLSVAIDVFTESIEDAMPPQNCGSKFSYHRILPSEVTFVSAISAHPCVFRLKSATAISHIPSIIAQGRASLEGAIAAVHFYLAASLSFSFYMLFCVCSVSTAVPFVPTLGAVCYHLVLLPIIGFTIAWSKADKDSMHRVPPKNDQTVTFGRNENWYKSAILKSIPPAFFPQLLHLVAYGELMIKFELDFVRENCSESIGVGDWAFLLRCVALKEYSGVARTSAGALVLAELIICTVVASATFVHGTIPIQELPPWHGNRVWIYSVLLGILLVAAILLGTLEKGSLSALPWYFYLIALVMPPACLAWNEMCKRSDRKHELRAEKLRRLQFETRCVLVHSFCCCPFKVLTPSPSVSVDWVCGVPSELGHT